MSLVNLAIHRDTLHSAQEALEHVTPQGRASRLGFRIESNMTVAIEGPQKGRLYAQEVVPERKPVQLVLL